MFQIGLYDQQLDLCSDIFKNKIEGDLNVKPFQYIKECK